MEGEELLKGLWMTIIPRSMENSMEGAEESLVFWAMNYLRLVPFRDLVKGLHT